MSPAPRRPTPARPFTVPRPAGRPAGWRVPRNIRRRGVLAVAVALTVPAGIGWLVGHGRLPQAAVAVGLLALHVVCELAAAVARGRATAVVYLPAGPLAGYTPQVQDRLADYMDRGGRS